MKTEVNGCNCAQEADEAKYARIAEIIEEYKGKEGSLIQILHLAQGVYGYLPLELQQFVAQKMDISLSEVYGVVTFYSFFSTKPKSKYNIRVCMGTACYVRGGKKIVDKLQEILNIAVGEATPDDNFSLDVMRCIGACGLAPAITINDKVYKQINPDKLKSLLKSLK